MNIPGLGPLENLDVTHVLEQTSGWEKVVLFGSRAKGTAKRGSDVDLALLGRAVDRSVVLEISEKLNEETCSPYHYDILDYNSLTNQALKDHIDRVGIVLFDRTPPT